MRPEVQTLVRYGRFPKQEAASYDDVDKREKLIELITPPLTEEEARALLVCFGEDEFYGIAWALVHLIESVPGRTVVTSAEASSGNRWLKHLWDAAVRGGRV